MERNNWKGWLYLLPAMAFLGIFMVYPLIDVLIYSFEQGYSFTSQTAQGIGWYNYLYVLNDPYFLQAVKNTLILVIITVPLSTTLALLISLGLNSILRLRHLFQTIFFLPYVTNTLAVGLVFMILFKQTEYTDGLVNMILSVFGMTPVDFILGYTLPLIPIAMAEGVATYLFAIILGLEITGNILLSIVFIIPIALLYVGMGLLCGSVFNDKQVGGICGALLTNLSAWLSGIWFDLELVGGAFQKVANLLPFVHAVEMQRAIVAGNISRIFPHLWWVLGYSVVIITAAVLLFLRQMKQQ